MHEMSLAQSIVEIVENTAEANNTRKVSKVKLIVGELAGVEMHALMQGLKIASQETPMEGAEIEIERPQGTAWCMMCQKTVPLHRRLPRMRKLSAVDQRRNGIQSVRA